MPPLLTAATPPAAIWDHLAEIRMCTSLIYTDAAGKAYVGRTLELTVERPYQMVFLPAGHATASEVEGHSALTHAARHACLAVTMAARAPAAGAPPGIATAGPPASNTSVGRFVRAAFYAQFAEKADTPDGAVRTLAHILNNFDRPRGLTIDHPDKGGGRLEVAGLEEKSPPSRRTAGAAVRPHRRRGGACHARARGGRSGLTMRDHRAKDRTQDRKVAPLSRHRTGWRCER